MGYETGYIEDMYDVIIIGAGIGGLTCGCYLAKDGMKVLIVEQNDRPGGCCSSFKRKGIVFDAAVHRLASCGKDGLLGMILDELNLKTQIKFTRMDPTDIIITKDYEIPFKLDLDETIYLFCNTFPKEAQNIKNFFRYINSLERKNYLEYLKLGNKRFGDFLKTLFKDKDLISILSVLLLNTNVPSYEVSALVAALAYKQFLDGGYYPIDGMQGFSNIFARRFNEYGGMFLLSTKVEKIEIENRNVMGIRLAWNRFIRAKYVISNCDARQTYFELIGKEHLSTEFVKNINTLLIASSLFSVSLGLNRPLSRNNKKGGVIWYFPSKDFNKSFSNVFYGREPYLKEGLLCVLNLRPNGILNQDVQELLYISVTANYKDRRYWSENRERVANEIIERAEEIFPCLSRSIVVRSVSTPYDIERFTSNYRGSTSGWACTPSQVSSPVVRRNTGIKGLYMLGHWVNQSFGGGVATVADMGRKVAKFILRKEVY